MRLDRLYQREKRAILKKLPNVRIVEAPIGEYERQHVREVACYKLLGYRPVIWKVIAGTPEGDYFENRVEEKDDDTIHGGTILFLKDNGSSMDLQICILMGNINSCRNMWMAKLEVLWHELGHVVDVINNFHKKWNPKTGEIDVNLEEEEKNADLYCGRRIAVTGNLKLLRHYCLRMNVRTESRTGRGDEIYNAAAGSLVRTRQFRRWKKVLEANGLSL